METSLRGRRLTEPLLMRPRLSRPCHERHAGLIVADVLCGTLRSGNYVRSNRKRKSLNEAQWVSSGQAPKMLKFADATLSFLI
jgi:hypothetical protein